MCDVRRAGMLLLAAAGWICLGNGCRRAVLGDPDAGGAGVVGLDAGSPAVPSDGGTAADTFGTDLGVVGSADASASDGVIFGPVSSGSCLSAPPGGLCPIDRPPPGGACPVPGITCEYGGVDIGCRDSLRCADDLTWRPTRPECAPELADRCPAAPPESGSVCDSQVLCSYPGQTMCVCTSSDPMRWVCGSARVDPECPGQLPLQGSRCDHNGKRCSYGGCFLAGICCNGSWITAPEPCAE